MRKNRDLLETLANTVGGFFLSYAVALWVFPLLGIPMNPSTAGVATLTMFCVSFARSFVTRKLFRWLEERT